MLSYRSSEPSIWLPAGKRADLLLTGQEMVPEAFDLTALQLQLRAPKHKELAKNIQRFLSARSFETDLQAAKASLDEIAYVDTTDGRSRTVIGQALTLHAVMMYCRAAIEDGNGRFNVGITRDFSVELRAKHKEVVKLRNKSLAHFDVGEGTYGRDWIRERAVLKTDAKGHFGVTTVWSRANYRARLLFDLNELVDAGLLRVRSVAEARENDLAASLSQSFAADPALYQLLREHRFDPAEFFGSSEAADLFWRNQTNVTETYVPRATSSDSSFPIGEVKSTRVVLK